MTIQLFDSFTDFELTTHLYLGTHEKGEFQILNRFNRLRLYKNKQVFQEAARLCNAPIVVVEITSSMLVAYVRIQDAYNPFTNEFLPTGAYTLSTIRELERDGWVIIRQS